MADESLTHGKDEVSALARGLAVLKVVADANQPLSNRELAEGTGIPKATVSRLVATLLSAGYLRQAPGSERYNLGAATLQLGSAYLRTFDFRQRARLHLAELAETAGANVHLAVRDGLDMLLIDTLRPCSALILSRMDVGSRMTMATSAAGRAYLAALPLAQRDAAYEDIRASVGEGAWPRMAMRLAAVMDEYGRLGFCTSFGEWHPDIHALGFSLRGIEGELYGVSVGGPAYKLPPDWLLEKVAPALLEARRAISRETGEG